MTDPNRPFIARHNQVFRGSDPTPVATCLNPRLARWVAAGLNHVGAAIIDAETPTAEQAAASNLREPNADGS